MILLGDVLTAPSFFDVAGDEPPAGSWTDAPPAAPVNGLGATTPAPALPTISADDAVRLVLSSPAYPGLGRLGKTVLVALILLGVLYLVRRF